MISGMYMGEIVRLIVMNLANQKLIFGGHVSDTFKEPHRFYTKYVSEIEEWASYSLRLLIFLLCVLK